MPEEHNNPENVEMPLRCRHCDGYRPTDEGVFCGKRAERPKIAAYMLGNGYPCAQFEVSLEFRRFIHEDTRREVNAWIKKQALSAHTPMGMIAKKGVIE